MFAVTIDSILHGSVYTFAVTLVGPHYFTQNSSKLGGIKVPISWFWSLHISKV